MRAVLAPLLHSRTFLIGIVEFELLLGLLLLSGILPRLTWAASLLCFGGFALASLYKALSGDASCGCFGKLPVNPWYTVGLDSVAVASIFAFGSPGDLSVRFATRAVSYLFVGGLVVFVGVRLLLALPGGWARESGLVVQEKDLDLGTVWS